MCVDGPKPLERTNEIIAHLDGEFFQLETRSNPIAISRDIQLQ